jgi:hypothetical protein
VCGDLYNHVMGISNTYAAPEGQPPVVVHMACSAEHRWELRFNALRGSTTLESVATKER